MKILIVTEVIAGRGHLKAAESIAKSLTSQDPSTEVKIVHLIAKLSKTLEHIIEKLYITMITRIPKAWGWLHKRDSFFSAIFKEIIALAMITNIKRILDSERPDYVIATHATGLGALCKLKKSNNFKLAAVFTDYQVNRFWIHSEIDVYFVGHEDFQNKLLSKFNIPIEKIYVSGIPIDPAFSNINNKKTSVNIEKTKHFSILIMGGGLGLGGIKEIMSSLNSLSDIPIKLTVVTGTNQKLFNDLIKLNNTNKKNHIQILGYVEDIAELMKDFELLITKPGGLTISEAMAIQLPMILYQPIPGQEEENTKFLTKYNAAIKVENINDINKWVKHLRNHYDDYNELKQNQINLAKPNASIEIADYILNGNRTEQYIRVEHK